MNQTAHKVDEQVSEILRQKPRLSEALLLRARLPKRTGETLTP